MLDELDRQIVHALEVDGRAAFSRVAQVLGVSDQTVARRYRRLRAEESVRVVGNLDTWRIGAVSWYLRLQCTPDAAQSIAGALARRPDTAWVRMTSGGTEISCVTRARSQADTDALLLEKLHRTPRIVGISAHALIHMYYGGNESFLRKVQVLSDDQVAALKPPWAGEPAGEVPELGPGDRALLSALARDGRTGLPELAVATGWSETRVRRRLTELRRSGVLFFEVDVPGPALGLAMSAMMWLSVAPHALVQAAETLAGHPEVPFVAATTGSTNIVASLVCRDVGALYEYLTNRVAAIPAINHIETNPIVRTLKREGALLA
ncbi:Lrp/AsnC family transcriptional regulator [Cryptosporangium aurantiacum]|uniref:DNA-binding transcriptional regulator, Lrp family n=1 Tax=Cryptosporangium aurantiacum TaxID=134849 RepID=A0A1M7MRB3_9ACTN|nr:AsnC family transcriptional regulator [Cryptosporangium aurantiacum]SHM93601.1 DNA-binding transcriptional regulator, Lrp family [Cryptosporangium aurantiacum]